MPSVRRYDRAVHWPTSPISCLCGVVTNDYSGDSLRRHLEIWAKWWQRVKLRYDRYGAGKELVVAVSDEHVPGHRFEFKLTVHPRKPFRIACSCGWYEQTHRHEEVASLAREHLRQLATAVLTGGAATT